MNDDVLKLLEDAGIIQPPRQFDAGGMVDDAAYAQMANDATAAWETAKKKENEDFLASSAAKLYKQILAQGTTGKWTGEGFGGADANAREMAKMLAGAGIEDIRDFGRVKKTTYSQTPVQAEFEYTDYGTFPTGRYYIADPESGQRSYVDASQVKTGERTEGGYGADQGPSTVAYNYLETPTETTVFGNKKTGQEIDPNYNRAGGNVFGGTYTGKGRTNFNVQFGPDGTPYFYTQYGGSTSDFGKYAPIIGIGLSLFAPGIGGAIGSALSGTAATTLTSQVIGSAIVQGTMAELSGGDFVDGAIRGAVTAGAAPVVASTIGSSVAQAMGDSVFRNVVTGAVNNAATSALVAGVLNEDVGKAALNGAINGIASGVGQDVATAMEYGTDLFSPQTEMLRAQERGLGTSADAGGKFGVAGANILRGADPITTLINTTLSTITDDANSAPTAGSSGTTSTVAEADTGAEEGIDIPGMAQLEDILNQSSGTQLASSDNDAALQAIEDLRKPDMEEDPLLGLSSAEVGQGEQEAIDKANFDAISDLSSDSIGEDEQKAIDQTHLDDLLGLSSAEVGEDEQKAIDYQKAYDDLLGLSSAEVGEDEQKAIDYQKAYDDLLGLSSAEVGEDEQKAIDDALASEQTDPKGAKPGGAKPGGVKPGGAPPGGKNPGGANPGGPGSNMLGLLSLLGGVGAGATGQRASQQSEDQTSAEPLVAFDWTKPLQTTPFAAPATPPKMATGGSIDELLEMLQYRG